MNLPHGGNIYRVAECLRKKEREIIDFSASINPLGIPEGAVAAITRNIVSLTNYPDPDTKGLRRKIAEHEGLNPASIVCGNGSTELIYLIVRALQPERALIPAPTFSEYERACRVTQGITTVHFPLRKEDGFLLNPGEFIRAIGKERSKSGGRLMAFLCNPNNPTGALISRKEMLEIAGAARDMGVTFVVDEAFTDFCPGHSISDEVARNPYLVVLKSLTKIYALSGLRMGYAILPHELQKKALTAKEPWTVNTLAQAAASAALDDTAYIEETSRLMASQKGLLESGLGRLGISFLPSRPNYYLLSHPRAQEIQISLYRQGIMLRDCSNFAGLDKTYFRIAVKSEADNTRLLEELRGCLE